MPPLEPIRELVMRNLVTTLEGVRQGDTYWTTIGSVSRELGAPTDHAGVHVALYSPADRASEREGRGVYGATLTEMEVHVIAFAPREIASDTAAMRLAADIEYAVLQDRERGTYALNTWPLGRTITTPEQATYAEIVVRFVVQYRHAFGNPGTQK
jgi:hypothetical protein